MATTPHPQTPGLDDPIERWGRQTGVRGGAADWPGRSTFNEALKSAGIDPLRDAPAGMRAGSAPAAAPVAPPVTPKYTKPPVNPTTGGYVQNEQIPRGSPGLQSGYGSGQTGAAPGPGHIQGSGMGGGGGSPSLVGADPAKQVGLRAGLQAQPGVANKAGFLTTRAGGAINRGLIAPAKGLLASPWVAAPAAASAVMQNFNDYKINDPDVDSSASGTWNSLRNGDFAGAGRSLSKGALEAGMDLGSFAANTADYLVPGKAPVSTAYNKMLRNNFGDQLVDNSGSNPATAPASSTSAATNKLAPNQTAPTSQRTGLRLNDRQPLPAAQDPRLLNANTSRPELGQSRDFTNELSGRPGGNLPQLPADLREGVIHKTIDAQGRVTYSGRNVGTPGGGSVQMVDGMGKGLRNQGSVEIAAPGSFSSGPGGYAFTPSAATAEGRGLQKQEWDGKVAASNARAQSLREQEDTFDPTQRMSAGATARLIAHMNNKATLRGQDMSLEGQRLANQTSRNRLQYDMAKDERAYKDGRYDKHLEQDSKASEQAASAFKGLFDTTDNDGKPVSRPDLEAQANLIAKRASGGKWGTLSQAERDKHVGNAHSYVTLLDSARQHQNNGWMQEFGLDSPDAPRGGLPSPEELSNSVLERVGMREGATTPNASRGDYALRLPNGRVMYLGSNISGEHLKYLQNQGVK